MSKLFEKPEIAEILATHADVEPSFVYHLFEQEDGYSTPKVDVRAAVFHEDKILLTEIEQPYKDYLFILSTV